MVYDYFCLAFSSFAQENIPSMNTCWAKKNTINYTKNHLGTLMKKELARIIRNKAKYSNFAIQKMYWGQPITNNKQSHTCTHCNYIICII